MENYEVLTTAWFWVLIALIVVLHAAAMLARGLSKGVLTAVCAVNMIIHLLLFGLMFVNAASPEAVFLALLVSSAVALMTTKRGKEDGDGI